MATGCPQNIAKRGNYGAYLLQDKELSLSILTRMVKEIECPVTVKIRIFEDTQTTLDFVKAVEECGVQMLTVHGRTIQEKKQFVKEANWSIIKQIKESINIPVVANGGISCYADVVRCLEETNADAVMSSEALLENPKLFCPRGDIEFRENYVSSQLVTVHEYFALLHQYPLPQLVVPVVKAHLFKMLFRFLAASRNHDLRQLLGECRDISAMMDIVHEVENRTSDYKGRDAEAVHAGLVSPKTWYERYHDRDSSIVLPQQDHDA
jgi:tRNA-dihydrouridine synthase 1